ncbi:hypothetical protein MTR67_023980 [Solanum verrucosum]|uniref:Zinc finger GRF-type domain-containing protein n=1 Tax=Solanum verrucosum TaxID=315347 RepID=A0AAF0TY40_SOLVR|nr:hypothetical protein MTR67_023980 [Solanum verrucosum]
MSQDLSVSGLSTVKCQCGIATRIFTAFTSTNVGRRFYKCSKPNENNNLHREKEDLETRMADLEKYLASEIEENCERLDEITVPKSEEVVVDNEDVVVDKSKKRVYKMLIVIAMLWWCFAAFWVMK